MKKKKYEVEAKDMEEVFYEKQASFAAGDELSTMVSSLLDKSYYNLAANPMEWQFPDNDIKTPMQWIKIEQLPSGADGEGDNYRPKERMQGLFSSLQSLGHKTAFLLVRQEGYTGLYLGVHAKDEGGDGVNQLQQMAQVNLTGGQFSHADSREVKYALQAFPNYGIVTGQPSVRWNERENPLQNMDKLAAGFRNNKTGVERDYALLIVAEPAKDEEVRDILARIQRLQSDLHEYAKWTESSSLSKQSGESKSSGGSVNFGLDLIKIALTAACVGSGLGVLAIPLVSGLLQSGGGALMQGVSLGLNAFRSKSRSHATTLSNSVSSEHVNYMVKYCIDSLDKLVKRMEQGRNLGFWNTSVYILGQDSTTVDLVSATVRSVYSGQESYLEPIRTFNLGTARSIRSYITGMQLLPLPINNEVQELSQAVDDDESWHILGKLYEYMSTPVTTEELSIMMSLPKKDVAGLRIKNEAIEFSTNPTDTEGMRSIAIGELQDMGSGIGHYMKMDLDQLNSHGLIVGMNGSGKSVTSRALLKGVMRYSIPFMVVDPVKTDYVRWADSYNCANAGREGFKPIKIYAPGLKEIPGIQTPLSELKMNPFQPIGAKGAPLNMLGHIGALLTLLQKTLAMGDFLPMLLEEAVYNYIEGYFGPDILMGRPFYPEKNQKYPTFTNLQKQIVQLLQDRQYAAENTQNFTAAMQTRINSLVRGWKKDFFESEISTPPEELFESNVVICLAGVTSNSDKAFLMALILQVLNEYRNSKYLYDEAYRNMVVQGREEHNGSCLCHYTVVEEAHRILQAPRNSQSDADPQAVIAEMFSEMLSEIRECGEGLMIVDQYPSRLISDAIKNTNIKLIHRLQARDDMDAMAACVSLNQKQTGLIASLRKGNAIVNSGLDDVASWIKVIKEMD